MTGIVNRQPNVFHCVLLLMLAACPLTPRAIAQEPAKSSGARNAPCQINSQSPRIRLSGNVSDPSGGLVPGATIVLQCGNFRQETRSGVDGTYSIAVPAGSYEIEIAAPGFALQKQSSVAVVAGTNSEQTLDFSLEVESPASIVTVTANQGFLADSATTATKTDAPLIETPQSVSVVTSEQMRIRNVQTLGEIIRYSAGVSVDRFGSETRFDWFNIRGFDASSFGLFRDNSRWQSGTVEGQIDPYMLQEVDIIRGPSSVLYGQSIPGGLVNLVTKRPPAEPLGELVFNFGSFDRKQIQGDIGGPLDKNNRWRYRLTGLVRDSGTQVKYVPNDRRLLAPALTWSPGKTTLTILGDYQYDNLGWSQFLPSQGTFAANPNGRIRTDFFTGEPGYDYFHRQQWSGGYLFEHRFNDVFTVRQTSRYSRIAFDGKTAFGGGFPLPQNSNPPDLRNLNRFGFSNNLGLGIYTVDSQAFARFDTGFVQHSLLFGADYSYLNTKINSAFGSAPSLDVFNPVYGQPIASLAVSTRTEEPARQTGLYVQDNLKIAKKLVVTLSGRQDFTKLTTRDLRFNTEIEQSPDKFTGRAGITYVSDFGLAPYFSYSTSFLPTTGADRFSVPYQPTTGRQVEGGVKYQPANFNGFITASVFQINQRNVLTSLESNPFVFFQIGEIRARGFELEGVASVFSGLNLQASYSYLNQKVTETIEPTQVGKRPTLVPDRLLSFLADYTVPRGTFFGLGGNFGIRYAGTTAGNSQNTLILPAYTLLDAAGREDYKRVRFQATATNLPDKIYVPICQSEFYCNYGYRRNVIGSIQYRFGSLKDIFR